MPVKATRHVGSSGLRITRVGTMRGGQPGRGADLRTNRITLGQEKLAQLRGVGGGVGAGRGAAARTNGITLGREKARSAGGRAAAREGEPGAADANELRTPGQGTLPGARSSLLRRLRTAPARCRLGLEVRVERGRRDRHGEPRRDQRAVAEVHRLLNAGRERHLPARAQGLTGHPELVRRARCRPVGSRSPRPGSSAAPRRPSPGSCSTSSAALPARRDEARSRQHLAAARGDLQCHELTGRADLALGADPLDRAVRTDRDLGGGAADEEGGGEDDGEAAEGRRGVEHVGGRLQPTCPDGFRDFGAWTDRPAIARSVVAFPRPSLGKPSAPRQPGLPISPAASTRPLAAARPSARELLEHREAAPRRHRVDDARRVGVGARGDLLERAAGARAPRPRAPRARAGGPGRRASRSARVGRGRAVRRVERPRRERARAARAAARTRPCRPRAGR